MKILLLSDPTSVHTIKWARSLAEHGLEICIFGLSHSEESLYKNYPNIQTHSFGFDASIIRAKLGSLSKLRYLKVLPEVKRLIRSFKPDIMHAHFATSYGLIGALAGFQPFVLSVWGADIFDFPHQSVLHKELIKYNLKKAHTILSTGHIMAQEIGNYSTKAVEVTPFGIDLTLFKPRPVETLFDENDIVIGTVKTLEPKYGLEYLIKAFKILKVKHRALPLKLLIVGGGSQEQDLKKLVKELQIENDTIFTGRVSYDQISNYHNMLSIFVALSVLDSESFGVAVIEASACEKPVVVSNVGGLPEVVENDVTGFIVPPRQPDKAAEAIEKLILDKDLRVKMGRAGRERVKKLYNWDGNVRQMIGIYEGVLATHRRSS
jgi:glycosyltransferase involved in cell wall biosynthesis